MRSRWSGLLACLALTTAPSAALADSAAEHAEEDSAAHSAAEEPKLEKQTRAATLADASTAATAAATAGEVGEWGPVTNWPVVGVHIALLKNGKVLAYDSIGDNATETYPVHDHTRATVWDPTTGTHTDVRVNTGYNVFCSGLAHLADGALFLAGGNKDSSFTGLRQTHIFNSDTNTWSLGPNMIYERWYPSVTPLHNGELLITEGRPDTPEVRKTDGGLRTLSSAALNLPLYPWIDVAPSGRAFYSGPDQTLRSLDTAGTGSWQTHSQRDSINRSYGGHALYDIGKILVAGGGGSTSDARVINLNGTSPTVTATAPLATGRRQYNLTVLADGTVLANGGNSSGAALVDMNNGVYTAELWNPATGQWRTLAAEQVTRQYHATTLLLPDGRVLSSGGGICDTCDSVGYLAKNAQVFTPPYLFKKDGSGDLAARPSISSVPATVEYGSSLPITTPEAGTIAKVALVRLGAVTHSVNMEQRYVPLSFTRGSGVLNATGPANANVAPPGVYMLFVIGADGVPSVSRMIQVTSASSPPPPPPTNQPPTATITSPASGTSFAWHADINMAATASDPDGTVARVEFFRADGATKLGEDTTAPYTYRWKNAPAGTHLLRAKATDNAGATTTSSAVSVTARPKR